MGVTCVFVIITLMMTYQVIGVLGVQCEQDWPKNRTLQNTELKGLGEGKTLSTISITDCLKGKKSRM